MKQGSPPARAGVTLAVAPKANCQPWRINYNLSFTINTLANYAKLKEGGAA
jgi:hypothetical protein